MSAAPSPSDEPTPTPHEAGLAALAWSVGSGTAAEVIAQVRARTRLRRQRRLLAGASGCVALVVMALIWRMPLVSATSLPGTAPTPAVVIAPVCQTLPDGSVVDLKDGAAIRLAFTSTERRVELQTSEAHFQVTKDPSRPFVVVARGVEVRAVGTAFSVQIGTDAVDVLVTEGRVAVAQRPPAGLGEAPVSRATPVSIVDAGNRIMVGSTHGVGHVPPVVAVSSAEQGERLAWRVPRLEFTGTPLRVVIAMFNQHGRNRFTLDADLGDLQLSGSLRADDTDSLLLVLKNEFGLYAEPRGEGETWLGRH